MRILIITDNFAPAWAFGGTPKILFELSKRLVEKGHEITVITTNILDSKNVIDVNYKVINGIKVYYLKTLSRQLAWNMKIFIPIHLRLFFKENKKSFDLVIFSGFTGVSKLIGFKFVMDNKIPYVLFAFGSIPRGGDFKSLLKYINDSLFGNDIIKNACKLIAQNPDEMKQYLIRAAKNSQIACIPLFVDLSEFQDLPPRGFLRRKYMIKENEKIILFLGRIHEDKGLNLLLNTFSKLLHIQNNIKLVIVGRDDGFLFSMLNLIKVLDLEDKAIFVGPLYNRQRIAAYVDADIFVMPSYNFEETSLASLEACASYTPVIVTKQASDPLINIYEAGFIINYDEEELQQALLRILNDEKLRSEMGKNARRMIEEEFEVNKVVSQLEKIFEECIR